MPTIELFLFVGRCKSCKTLRNIDISEEAFGHAKILLDNDLSGQIEQATQQSNVMGYKDENVGFCEVLERKVRFIYDFNLVYKASIFNATDRQIGA